MRQQKQEEKIKLTLVEVLKEPAMQELVRGRLTVVAGN